MRLLWSAPTAGRVADARQRFVALVLGVMVASFGGLVLASAEGTLSALPGLLLLVPGAIALHDGMRGFTAGLQPYAARLKTRNQLRLCWDHGGLLGFVLFLPFFFVLVMASSLLYALRGDGATVGALWTGVVEGFRWLIRGRA